MAKCFTNGPAAIYRFRRHHHHELSVQIGMPMARVYRVTRVTHLQVDEGSGLVAAEFSPQVGLRPAARLLGPGLVLQQWRSRAG